MLRSETRVKHLSCLYSFHVCTGAQLTSYPMNNGTCFHWGVQRPSRNVMLATDVQAVLWIANMYFRPHSSPWCAHKSAQGQIYLSTFIRRVHHQY
jgi:hypothetical protein